MEHSLKLSTVSRIAFIGNYLPRQCGIATFTTDLCEAIASAYQETTCIALPVNDIESGYAYPSRVRFELTEKDIESYHRAADFLNVNNVDLVCLQFEYGIFGGRAGSHILALLRNLRMPIVTTLHTILEDPDPDQRQVLKQVASLSDRIVVMSERAVEFLQTIYGIQPDKIDLIPHGIPDMPFVDPSFHKDLFGVEGKVVLLSFGLLSPNKGLETVIAALPAILSKHPNVVYIILGATHPHIVRNEGETYRLSLEWLAHEKRVEGNVIFYNRFVALEELIEFIGATDIYITPYLDPAQIVSGTLAYTLGAGKAVISTPYWYAQEMLSEGRGALVPFRDSVALADQVIDLLDNEAKRHSMRKRAYLYGREMIWPQVAKRYMQSFERARVERRHFSSHGFSIKPLDKRRGELPPLKLDHLRHMTDDTGILQHAFFTIPNYEEGYTTDDNARALMVSTLMQELGSGKVFGPAFRYLAFVWYAYNPETGRFRNFMDYQRNWLEANGSDDSHGRSLWALGTVLGRASIPTLPSIAGRLFEQALPAILQTSSPRAWAFALIGIHEYLQRFAGDRMASQVKEELAGRLHTLYQNNNAKDWHWFESGLSYCNAVLPHSMLLSGRSIPNDSMTQIGLESLSWLADLQRADAEGGHFVPIGSNGFYPRGGEHARFDQQPVEAQAMVSACLEAYRSSRDPRWRKEARRAFEWFLGRNDLSSPVYDPTTGGCRDGLHPDRVNENQGAESTLAFLQSLLELRLAENPLDIEEI
ncbi:glycosyltransferase, group 1 family protein [Leptospira broomii serovar Hurstbridge str. 5399]|uniref:Glycosyltransferase, group 1 family protein n=1 Tax=Leptospira broomii serovar Hurstbridge str. 5399 TaxID=1049789 RepID=T0G995_9LEPT|nr:glycosyltransferase family 4 protein [Leptospira broomii]EQA43399.1 glycosyltransferase, group 1 family protein [Leptospira broomii serovar Hurstbridge str. 5399]